MLTKPVRPTTTALFASVVCALAVVGPARAAAPPNDNIADATEVSGLPVDITASTVGATREPDEPTNGGNSVWFRWVAPTDTGATVDLVECVKETVPTSVALEVFLDSPVFGLVRTDQVFHADAGRVYWIAISTPRDQPEDPDICVRLRPGPANDDFAEAAPLNGFPVSATYQSSSAVGAPTVEPGEPDPSGGQFNPPLPGSVWYSWTAPVSGPVILRVCGGGVVSVYTGARVNALTGWGTRSSREHVCAGNPGAILTLSVVEGESYRIAITGPTNRLRLLIGTQLAVLAGRRPALLYTAFPGDTDALKLRLSGAGGGRALLVDADGVTAANGCEASAPTAQLRCRIPGRADVALDVDLKDRNDTADVDLLRSVRRSPLWRRVSGGDGNDTLAGSAGAYRLGRGWTGGLMLLGGPGADRFAGGPGYESIRGGPGRDVIRPGAGSDVVAAGGGADRILATDGLSDRIDCAAGRDRARLDGIDLPRRCERRILRSPARAVPTYAEVSNSDGEDDPHLNIVIACPIGVNGRCATKVTAAVGRHRAMTRRVRVRAGRLTTVTTYKFSFKVVRRGVRVTAITRRGRGGPVKCTRRLPVYDNQYFGEG